MLNDSQKMQVVDTLTQRLKQKQRGFVCPMCSHDKFVLLDSYIRNEIVTDLDGVQLGGPSVPAAAIICVNCGFISQHALGTLNLLPTKKESSGQPPIPAGGA